MAFWDSWFAKDDTNSAVAKAAAAGNTLAVDKLIAAGANVNTTDTSGATALHHAIMSGNSDILKSLLDVGGPMDLKVAAKAFNDEATRQQVAQVADPGVALGGDIEVRKPLQFKRKA